MILTKLRFENQQKKCQLYPNKKASFLFELALFQLFVDLFVTQGGFEPPTLRAEI